LKPGEAFLRLPPLLPCGDLALLVPITYCAVGRIRYSCVDRKANDTSHAHLKDDDFDGTLIYIKAFVIGDEPRDFINYGRGSVPLMSCARLRRLNPHRACQFGRYMRSTSEVRVNPRPGSPAHSMMLAQASVRLPNDRFHGGAYPGPRGFRRTPAAAG
jgi:hypothetical protein